jgi:hypothetical protein
MAKSNRGAVAPLSALIRNRKVRAAFETADRTYGDEGMAGLKPKLGAYSGGKMPSILSHHYQILFMFGQTLLASKIRIEQGAARQLDHTNVEMFTRTFKLWKLDPRDFGFDRLTEFDVEVALANEGSCDP